MNSNIFFGIGLFVRDFNDSTCFDDRGIAETIDAYNLLCIRDISENLIRDLIRTHIARKFIASQGYLL